MKAKMSDEKKAILMYSGELLLIGCVFLVLSILRFVGIFKTGETPHRIFNWITIFGGTWVIVDFFWSNFFPKRRAKVTLLDKYLTLPMGVFCVVFDIFCFANEKFFQDNAIWQYALGALFMYAAVSLIFQSIFHYKFPTKELLRAIEEDKLAAEQEKQKSEVENTPSEEIKEEK